MSLFTGGQHPGCQNQPVMGQCTLGTEGGPTGRNFIPQTTKHGARTLATSAKSKVLKDESSHIPAELKDLYAADPDFQRPGDCNNQG